MRKIMLDLDGVVVDLGRELVRKLNQQTGKGLSNRHMVDYYYENVFGITKETMDRFLLYNRLYWLCTRLRRW